MLLSIDLSETTQSDAQRVIRAINAYYEEPAAVQTPLPLPTPVPSTAAATPLQTAPVEQAVGAQVPMPVILPPAPPPAPVAAAPTAPVAPTNPANVELDKDGLPWDARIHSSTKAKTADGAWRAKRGINGGDLVARVTAELRATMAVAAPAASPAPPMPSVVMPGAGPSAQDVFAPPPPTAVAIPAATTDAPMTFQQLMPMVTGAMLANKLPQTALVEAINSIGLPTIPSLSQRPDLVPMVWASLLAKYPAIAQP